MNDDSPNSGSHEVAEAVHRLIHMGFIVFPIAIALTAGRISSERACILIYVAFFFLILAAASKIAAAIRRKVRAARERR